jgi:uroporphyrinogen decarboxylase
MHPKERVLRAIGHQPVDRAPYFYYAEPSVTARLAEYMGLDDHSVDAVNDRLGAGVRYIRPGLNEVDGEVRKEFQVGGVHAQLYGDGDCEALIVQDLPLEHATGVEDVLAYSGWPDPDWYDYTIPAEIVEANRERAIFTTGMGVLFLYAMGLRGTENALVDLAVNPDLTHALYDRLSDFNLTRTRRFLEANAGVIDVLGVGDDVAGQSGMFFSPRMWHDFLRPHVQKMVDLAHEFGVVPYFHGCGGYRDLFDQFIEMGIRMVGRMQTHAKGNDLADLKRDYGDRLCLYGGVDSQHLLIEGAPEDVRRHVRDVLEIGSPGGGFIIGPTHTFTDDVPLENIVAMYEELGASQAR